MDKALENSVKAFMAEKIAAGVSLSEVQSLVNAEFSLSMTYMDIRILASELEIDWQKLNPEQSKTAPEQTGSVENADIPDAAGVPEEENIPEEANAPAGAMPDLSTTRVEVSKIARPGMMFSGSATFANGSTADWYLDNMGRLGVDNLQGAQPGQEDIEKFQIALQLELRKLMGR